MLRLVAIQLLILFLVSCGSSPPLNYYLLTANIPGGNPGGEEGAPATRVGVGPVSIPEYLQRIQIAFSGTDNRLQVASNDRWSEPLELAIPRVIATNLARLDGGRFVTVFPWRQDEEPEYTVRIDLVHLNRNTDNLAAIEAHWRLLDNRTKSVLERGTFQATKNMDQFSYAALAAAYSDLLAELSRTLHAAIEDNPIDES